MISQKEDPFEREIGKFMEFGERREQEARRSSFPGSKNLESASRKAWQRRQGVPSSALPEKKPSSISVREFKYKLENNPNPLIPGTAGKRYTKPELKGIAGEIEAENKKLGGYSLIEDRNKDKIIKSFEKKMYAAPRGTPERLELEHKWKFVKEYLNK